MFKSGSTSLVKDLNKKHILNLVRMQPGITARSISDITGLQFSTVQYMLKSLRKENYIRESGLGPSTLRGGKPPLTWEINADYGYVLGAELLSSEFRIILLDFKGIPVQREIVPLSFSQNAEQLVSMIHAALKKFLAAAHIFDKRLLGLGVGISGTVNNEEGTIVYARKQDFHNTPFREMLSTRLPIPIEIENDANAAALGVKWLDPQEFETDNIIYADIQQHFDGMGVGFIINHELYRGANNAAGEIASFLPSTFWQRVCKRVSAGCSFCRDSNTSKKLKPDLSLIVEKALSNDHDAVFILRELAKEIRKKMVLLVDLFNPRALVIGGDICGAQSIIEPVIKERLRSGVVSEAAQNTRLRFSSFGAYSGAYGGAALVFRKIFS